MSFLARVFLALAILDLLIAPWAFGPVSRSLAQSDVIKTTLGFTFVKIPAGSFTMGYGEGFFGDGEYEKPGHQVKITKAFYLSAYEVTQAQWSQVMGTNPSNRRRAPTNPVENVSWNEANEFLAKLSQIDGRKYRLPTEAEWEYAARSGSNTAYHFGNDPAKLSEYGWCGESFLEGGSHPVGQKKPNAFGLYDMNGNLSEWVEDWFMEKYYFDSPANDPKGPGLGTDKVHRGGAYNSDPKVCQSAWRDFEDPATHSESISLRIAFD
ncbi:MAG: formylglycine-generating enzyme family protein [Deltaproteobacteria bacterium]|nr:formylglycine-generating enzyme family protein [Deltaproteobacteria bacterium]